MTGKQHLRQKRRSGQIASDDRVSVTTQPSVNASWTADCTAPPVTAPPPAT